MIYRIKNLTNSPYQITLEDGSNVILGARAEVDAEINHKYITLYRQLGYFKVSEVAGQDSTARRGRPRKESAQS